eukprot:219965_1
MLHLLHSFLEQLLMATRNTFSLLFGFCRNQHNFPFSLIQLLHRFYTQDIGKYFVVWIGTSIRSILNTDQSSIQFVDITKSSKQCIKYKIDDRYHSGFSVISASNLNLPQYFKKEIIKNYNKCNLKQSPFINTKILFDCGGSLRSNHQFTNKCNAMIVQFDSNNSIIHNYSIQLPSLPQPIAHPNIITQFINSKICNIYCIGGARANKKSNEIYRMDMTHKQPKWTLEALLKHEKCGMSCCVISQQLLFIFGAVGANAIWNEIEMFDILNDVITRIPINSKLKYGRYKSVCCELEWYKQIIIAGGLSENSSCLKQVELLDINTQKMNVMKAKLQNKHAYNPLLWSDYNNPNIVYIGGRVIANKRCVGSFLGDVEWIDMREKKETWNVLTKSMADLCMLADTQKWIRNICC